MTIGIKQEDTKVKRAKANTTFHVLFYKTEEKKSSQYSIKVGKNIWPEFMSINKYAGVGIAHSVQQRATGSTAWVRLPAGIKNISLLHSDQTGPQAHPAYSTIGTGGSFSGGEEAGV
jgi:hypothetical protein